jgi:hypothetical protein
MKRIIPAVIILALILIAAPGILFRLRWERIRNSESGNSRPSLPDGAIVLTAADAEFTAPFQRVVAPATPSSHAAGIPQGAASAGGTGRAALPFSAPASGMYSLWLRCRWMDSCGNSLSVSLDDSSPQTVGQDGVYGVWHWIRAGQIDLPSGDHRLTLAEREDGIEVDQALLTTDAGFTPSGPIADGRQSRDIRRFADAFDRSPGHGSPDWTFEKGDWRISFSLDPNRIPHQYSLEVTPGSGETAEAVLRGAPWTGLRVECSVMAAPNTELGIAFRNGDGSPCDDATVVVPPNAGEARIGGMEVDTATAVLPADTLRPNQWHRLVVERWAWICRVRLDDVPVLERTDLAATPLIPCLTARAGTAVFDDVRITEIAWQGDDGHDFQTDWSAGANSDWRRARQPGRGGTLRGAAGTLTPATFWPLPVAEMVVWNTRPNSDGLQVASLPNRRSIAPRTAAYLPNSSSNAAAPPVLAADGPVTIRRLAWRYTSRATDAFRIGPYTFAGSTIPDPADYLDFTKEEVAAIESSPDAQKLIRKPKQMAVVGKSGQYAVWAAESGSWHVADGVLNGAGHNARARFWQEIDADATMHFRVRLSTPSSVASVTMAEDPQSRAHVALGPQGAAAPETDSAGTVPLPADGQWHRVAVALSGAALVVTVDDNSPVACAIERGDGGGVLLGVDTGRARFDDVEFLVPRAAGEAYFYGFDKRETDWWRIGKDWIDHGGIACALASNWISLIAPESSGVLINKRDFSGDLLLAFNIEENSEWMGWDKDPSHIHYPFDNIQLYLAPKSGEINNGYRIDINAQNRSETVLYRKNEPVKTVKQDSGFPIAYVGGHAPYRPRRNRIKLIRRNNALTLIINGTPVLNYTDPDPIGTSRVAIGGHDTRVNFSRIVVRGLDMPSSPEIAGRSSQ